MKKDEQCLLEAQKELLEKMLQIKIQSLEDELKNEEELFQETGFYSNRSTEEIEKELKTAKHVLRNIDKLPKCKK